MDRIFRKLLSLAAAFILMVSFSIPLQAADDGDTVDKTALLDAVSIDPSMFGNVTIPENTTGPVLIAALDNFTAVHNDEQAVYDSADATQDEVNTAVNALTKAITTVSTAYQTQPLWWELNRKPTDPSEYTSASWASYLIAWDAANDIYEMYNNDIGLSGTFATRAAEDLKSARENLVPIANINFLLDKMGQKPSDPTVYTEDSWAVYLAVWNAAQAAADDPDVTQQEVDAAAGALSDAFDALALKPDYGLRGDVSGDGTVDTVDVRMVLQGIVGKLTLDEGGRWRADVSGDGVVDTTDARLILQYIVSKIEKF